METQASDHKRCSKCGEAKPRTEFNKASARKDGLQPRCKACLFQYREANREREHRRAAEWAAQNPDKVRENGRKWAARNPEVGKLWAANNRGKRQAVNNAYYLRNREEILARKKAYLAAHPDRKLQWNQAYATRFPDKINALTALRRAAQLQATPGWADLAEIREVYTRAAASGDQVDHIVPLRSKLVCGLHTQANLQPLSAAENLRKRNYTWPDMP